MANGGSIVIEVLIRADSFVTKADHADKAIKKLKDSAKDLHTEVKAMGPALGKGLLSVASSLTDLLDSSIERMDETRKAARLMGMSTEDLSKLAYAASFADLSVKDLQLTISQLTKAQAEAQDPSSQQARIFDALEISIKDANGELRPAIDLLYDFADAFKAQKGTPEMAAAGIAIFGNGFPSLISLLEDGSKGLRDAGIEAASFGQVISGEAGANAEAFNDNLARMKVFVQGVGNAVAADLLPDLLSMSGQLLDSAKTGEKLNEVASTIAGGLRVLGTAASYIAKGFEVAGAAIAASLATAHAGFLLLKGDFRGSAEMFGMGQKGLIDSVIGDASGSKPAAQVKNAANLADDAMGFLTGIREQADAEKRGKQQAGALRTALSPSGGRGRKTADDGQMRAAGDLEGAYARLNAQLDEQIALHGKVGAAARLEYELTMGSLKGLGDVEKDGLRQKQAVIDQLDVQAEQVEGQSAAERDRKRAFEGKKAELEFELKLLGLSNEEREKEKALRELGIEAAEEEGKILVTLKDALNDRSKAMAGLIGLQDEMRGKFAESFSDVVRGTESAKDALDGFFDSMASNILKMIAENFTASLFGEKGQNGGGLLGGLMSKMLGGVAGDGGTSGGGFFSSIASGIAGMFGGAKATGGDVLAGRGYWVGEEGPEWFEPRGTGSIIPVAAAMATGREGRQIVQNLNVTVAGRPDRRTPMQIAREAGRESSRAMARNGR
jgi:hypothetical protein